MPSVLCLGEILVDWVCTTVGAELDEAKSFTKAPGGAPANVAVGLSRQGVSTGFLGRVSGDAFGMWLKDVLIADGIDTTGTVVDPKAQTRMAYVVTTITGDRKLAEFSRIACADARIEAGDLNETQFKQAAVLHFGSISLISSPAKEATMKALELARKHNLLTSYDPNVRIGLWPGEEACRTAILDTLKWADLVKINLDELEFLTGSRDFETAEKLRKEHKIPLMVITLDAEGAYFTCDAGSQEVPGFKVKLVEATGAGDGFVSGLLAGFLPIVEKSSNRRQALADLPLNTLKPIFQRANAVGALACTKKGAIPALPTGEEVNSFLEQPAVHP